MCVSGRENNGHAMAGQEDKRTTAILSTTESCNIIQVRTHRGQVKDKDLVVLFYNNMMEIDKMNQLITYVLFLPPLVHKVVKKGPRLASGWVCNKLIHYLHPQTLALGTATPGHYQFHRAIVLSCCQ